MRSLEYQQSLIKEQIHQHKEIERTRLLDEIQGVKDRLAQVREVMELELKRAESEAEHAQM